MDHIHQNTRPATGFTIVPDRLIDDDSLSADARMALLWICSRPDGYVCRTSMIQQRLNIGKDRWQRIFRELKDAGAVTRQWNRCKRTGRLIGQAYHWSWAKWLEPTESRETRPSVTTREKPTESRVSRRPVNPAETGGKSGRDRRETRLLKEEREKGKERAARASYEKWKAWSARTGGGTYGDWLDTEEGKAALREEQAGPKHDA